MTVIADGKEQERECYSDYDRERIFGKDDKLVVARLRPILRDGEFIAEMLAGPPCIFKAFRKS